MSTRGFVGVYIDGTTKGTYNHCDSYPEYLGVKTVTSLANMGQNYPEINFRKKAEEWIAVNEEQPNEQMIQKYAKCLNRSVDDEKSWDALSRRLEGELLEHLANVEHFSDDTLFLQDTLFCEWAYIWNMDDNTLEVYSKQREPLSESRYPIPLVAKLSIDENLIKNFNKCFGFRE